MFGVFNLLSLDPWRGIVNQTPAAPIIETKENISKGVGNIVQGTAKVAGDIFGGLADFVNILKKYWYVPVIVGGVIVGYRLIKNNNPQALTASAIRALAAQK